MADERSAEPKSPRRLGRFGWTVITLALLAVQLGLPILSTYVVYQWQSWEILFDRILMRTPLYPYISVGQRFPMSSVAICKNELVILFFNSHNLMRVDLLSGQKTLEDSPQGSHVLSDGQRFWIVPRSGRSTSWPFLLDGRPVVIEHGRSESVILELVNDHWQKTETFVFMPDRSARIECDLKNSQLCAMSHSYGAWYGAGIEFGTEDQIRCLTRDYLQLSDDGVLQFGSRLAFVGGGPDRLMEWGWRTTESFKYRYPRIGFWYEDDHISELRYCLGEWHRSQAGFMRSRFKMRGPIEIEFAPLPVRWSYREHEAQDYRVVNAGDGRIFVVKCDGPERLLEVYQWEDGRFRLVLQRNRQLIRRVCLQVSLVLLFVVAIPTALFSAILIERRRSRKRFRYAHDVVVLGSGFRRGMARLLDLALIVPLWALSVVCHPDFAGWWRDVAESLSNLVMSVQRLIKAPIPSRFHLVVQNLYTSLDQFFSVPTVKWMLAIVITVWLWQAYRQAHTGRTFGKWVCGLKVLRTTLRPCGFARSIMRELLLVVDSFLLLSWIPGIISIVSSENSQRIGDKLADTIVVRD